MSIDQLMADAGLSEVGEGIWVDLERAARDGRRARFQTAAGRAHQALMVDRAREALKRKHGTRRDRFMRKVRVNEDTGCWEWIGCVTNGTMASGGGYGRFDGRWAHRVSWELHRGPIPQGLEIDHLCRVRHCVNPDHIEPVTKQENAVRRETARRASLV